MLDEIMAIQDKIESNMAQLAGQTAETEHTIYKIQEEWQHIGLMKKKKRSKPYKQNKRWIQKELLYVVGMKV